MTTLPSAGELPEELVVEAREIAANIPSRVTDANRDFAANVIARALMAERERAARIAGPSGPRPCDCDRCYCGNPGDTEAAARWDAANAIAVAILSDKEQSHDA